MVRLRAHHYASDLVRIAIALMKHHEQSNLRMKRFIHLILPQHSSSSEKVRGETWRQELKKEAMEGSAHWLAPHGLLSLLSYRTQGYQPREDTTHNGPGPPPSTTNEENALQALLKPDLMEALSHSRLPPF